MAQLTLEKTPKDNSELKLIAATEMLLNWLIEKSKIESSTTEAVSEKL